MWDYGPTYMGRDRTSDVPSPRYVHLRRRPSVWGRGGLGVLSIDMWHMCVALGFNVILAVWSVRAS